MKAKNSFLIILLGPLLGIVFSSCYWRSLHPLSTKNNLVMDSTILGSWSDNSSTWNISKGTDTSYVVSIISNEKEIKFIGHLVKLNNYYFLDILPDKDKILDTDYATYLESVHSFSRIWIYKDSIQTADINYDWLKKKLAEKNQTLKFEWLSEERILFTASTQELQQFVTKFADDTLAFSTKQTSYRKIN